MQKRRPILFQHLSSKKVNLKSTLTSRCRITPRMACCFDRVPVSVAGLACLLLLYPSSSLCQLVIKPDGDTGGVNSVTKIGNEVWLAAVNGTFRYDPQHNRAVRVEGDTGSVYEVAPLIKEVWLAAQHGAFRYDPQHNRAVRVEGDPDRGVYLIALVNNEVWLAASGSYLPL